MRRILLAVAVTAAVLAAGIARADVKFKETVKDKLKRSKVAGPAFVEITRGTFRAKGRVFDTPAFGGVNPALFGPTTPVAISVGGFHFSGVLGDDPKYTPGAKKATFKMYREDVTLGKTILVYRVQLRASPRGLKISVKGFADADEGILAGAFLDQTTGMYGDNTMSAYIRIGDLEQTAPVLSVLRVLTKTKVKDGQAYSLSKVVMKAETFE